MLDIWKKKRFWTYFDMNFFLYFVSYKQHMNYFYTLQFHPNKHNPAALRALRHQVYNV